MMKLLYVALAALLLVGCAAQPKVVEGTHFALGAYLPYDGQIYGVELMQFTNGAVVNFSTNTVAKYQREYASTNSYLWGMVETREWSKTKLELPEDR